MSRQNWLPAGGQQAREPGLTEAGAASGQAECVVWRGILLEFCFDRMVSY
jgi:hypothetical protein